ncbi:hypothetical protein M4D54_09475 [Brachybacterium sp. p3-SID1565]|uniref:hypothetical protein n=1 Tax=Brachybacterium sp. p3-SID1565 TaxID=2916046 RepID=UPI0021A40654|nr:hypothetical protein [Brachybacterium sp. p3-SID1565]MCT1385851.1 hypothetical protein [Brachybacterium sp. p3-SID1565]
MRRRTFLGSTAALGSIGLVAACAPGSDTGGGSGGTDGGGYGPALPMVILFLFLQRYFIRSMLEGATTS